MYSFCLINQQKLYEPQTYLDHQQTHLATLNIHTNRIKSVHLCQIFYKLNQQSLLFILNSEDKAPSWLEYMLTTELTVNRNTSVLTVVFVVCLFVFLNKGEVEGLKW